MSRSRKREAGSIYFSTNFIIKNINKIFISDKGVNTETLNIENYLLIEKKLDLPKNRSDEDIKLSN